MGGGVYTTLQNFVDPEGKDLEAAVSADVEAEEVLVILNPQRGERLVGMLSEEVQGDEEIQAHDERTRHIPSQQDADHFQQRVGNGVLHVSQEAGEAVGDAEGGRKMGGAVRHASNQAEGLASHGEKVEPGEDEEDPEQCRGMIEDVDPSGRPQPIDGKIGEGGHKAEPWIDEREKEVPESQPERGGGRWIGLLQDIRLGLKGLRLRFSMHLHLICLGTVRGVEKGPTAPADDLLHVGVALFLMAAVVVQVSGQCQVDDCPGRLDDLSF